jgi:sarcosine oxidase subunit gamma
MSAAMVDVVATTLARSPLGTTEPGSVAVATGSSVEVLEHPFVRQFSVRGEPGSRDTRELPAVPNTVLRTPGQTALWLGPDEWLVLGSAPATAALEVSGHRTLLEVRGPAARDLLARGCPLDLDERTFTANRCAQTLLARVDVILFRLEAPEDDGGEAFGVLVRSSFARYLVDWLRDAIEGLEA